MANYTEDIRDVVDTILEAISLRIWVIGLTAVILVIGMISPRYALDKLKEMADL